MSEVRIVKHYKGRLVSVTGAMSHAKAVKRLAKLRTANPHDGYELQDVQ